VLGSVEAGGADGGAGGGGAAAGRRYDESEGFNLKIWVTMASTWAYTYT